MNRLVRFAFLSLIAISLETFPVTSVVHASDPTQLWSQWRGPSRDGQIVGEPWPDRLSGGTLTQSWTLPLAPSYSGPIVSDDRVFVTETRDRQTEVVQALDRETGRQLWSVQWPGSLSVPIFAKSNGDWIRATPTFDGERLYVAGIRDVLVCLDADTGTEIWRVDFVEQLESKLPSFGCVCSPLVDGDFVYVQAGAGLVKLNKLTGEIVWRTLDDGGGMMGSALSSPVLADLAGRRQLVVQTRQKLAGVDPESGTPLWSIDVPAFRGMNILTPTIHNDSVFTSSYGGGSFLFRISRGPDGFQVKQVWKNKVQAYMSSPVVIDGFAYLHLRNQRFACIDLATGKERWITTPFGKYWSMITQGKRILALDESGDLLLIQANPEKFELLDSRHVSDSPTWAHLAIDDHQLFIRQLDAQSVYRWKNP